MQVRQSWKSHVHVIQMHWGVNKRLKIELGNGVMTLTRKNVDQAIFNVLDKAYEKAVTQSRYPQFREAVMEAAAATTELTTFLKEVERL